MVEAFDIQKYMTSGVKRIIKDALQATITNPAQMAYLTQFAIAAKKASAKRRNAEDLGEHIPPFLIASITSSCNLHCKGCYTARDAIHVRTELQRTALRPIS